MTNQTDALIAAKDAEIAELKEKLEKCKRVAREYTADNADFELLLLELDQQGSTSNPAPVHGQSKTGLTSSQLDAPTLEAVRVIMQKYGFQCRDMADEIIDLVLSKQTDALIAAKDAEIAELKSVADMLAKGNFAKLHDDEAHLTDALIAAAYMAAGDSVDNTNMAIIALLPATRVHKYQAEVIRRLTPADAKAKLRELCLDVARATSTYDDQDLVAIVDEVLSK